MGRRFWLLAGALLVGVFTVTWFTPRKPRPRVSMPWLLAVLLGTRLTSWWNPATWGSEIGHIASSAIRDIENWARNAINWAASLLDEAGNLAMDVVNGAINELTNAANFIAGVASAAWDWVANAASTVGGWIDSATSWLWANVVAPALDDLRNWAVDALNGLGSVFDTLSNWVTDFYNNVLLPVWHWVEGAEQWLQARLASWWDQVWAVTFGPVWSGLQWLLDNVPSWIDWLAKEAYPMVHAMWESDLDLLQFFTDPVGFIESQAEGIESGFSGGWVKAMAAGDKSLAGGIEADIVRVLGG